MSDGGLLRIVIGAQWMRKTFGPNITEFLV